MEKSRPKWKIWIDTGGTFTDCIAIDPFGHKKSLKVLSNSTLRGRITQFPDAKSLNFVNNWAFEKDIFIDYDFYLLSHPSQVNKIKSIDFDKKLIILKEPLNLVNSNMDFAITANEEVPVLACRIITETTLAKKLPPMELRLGSTRGTNALLEGTGAKVTFLVTKGHRDLLEIGYQQRPHLFALNIIKPKPLYHTVIEVDERIVEDGRVIKALNEDEMHGVISKLKSNAPEAIAVCFLHSYCNPIHERTLREKLIEAGFKNISISSEISPTIKIIPRAQTTIVNAYLKQVMEEYLENIYMKLPEGSLKVMTSSGGLVDNKNFKPKDSLLSGPAGGIVGASHKGALSGYHKLLTLDMGGTSTDVARYDHDFDYKFIIKVGNAEITSPSLAIETIAAGGGSICTTDGYKLLVGPQSAGANPGPACYGTGGPLTLTDINLLLGRIDEESFGIPISLKSSELALDKILKRIGEGNNSQISKEELCSGFLDIANEKMAEAIRKISVGKGFDPTEYVLLAFGGAGGQHACRVAELLKIVKIIIPYDAGLLSAFGIGQALLERIVTKQVLKTLTEFQSKITGTVDSLKNEGFRLLQGEGYHLSDIELRKVLLFLRFKGQETSVEIEFQSQDNILEEFEKQYRALYGHWIDDREVEVESIRVIVSNIKNEESEQEISSIQAYHPEPTKIRKSFINNKWSDLELYTWEDLEPGADILGPALIVSFNSTVFLMLGWRFVLDKNHNALLSAIPTSQKISSKNPEAATLELYTNRLMSIADDMGAQLQRTSFSVNIKERLDFSCGILDNKGYLIVNAPHIPVHLGGLGICVRSVLDKLNIVEGDVVITNHPGFGGSHLPDITLITPVYYQDQLLGYVANRAHHAEIGGTRPGSMPPDAKCLLEEGVAIPPTFLVKKGMANWDEIEKLFITSKYPTRSINENIADLNGALASILEGEKRLKMMAEEFGIDEVIKYFGKIKAYGNQCLIRKFHSLDKQYAAKEYLDDGTLLNINISISNDKMLIDFDGSGEIHPGNMNATRAIVHSVVIYVLRVLADEDIPLNEGLLESVSIKIPTCMLNPIFGDDDSKNPAVVGGNTEISQRLTDTFLKALKLVACSQGTMNNLLFGNDSFGYYETICGGTGAGNGFHGSSGVHQHMTNTRITDPEVMELNYPVTLKSFSLRSGSGGKGKWNGGDGVVRELLFKERVSFTILSQHRNYAPFGMQGGGEGKKGMQYIIRSDGTKESLNGIDKAELKAGDTIVVKTPGGGGWGKVSKI